MTGDKRLFTKNFSDKLLASLPYVPVVGYYDEEEEDFKGHNPSIQNIYGMVPEDAEINYVKEDGKEYAICDVILYTGRGDKTGEIAKKIVGKSQSLELNPADTKYKMNKNSKGEIQSIEFTAGSLLGLSVLGDNEKPAFSGSEFFNEDSNLMSMFDGFKEQLELFYQQNQQRGEKMSVKADTTITEEIIPVVEETILQSEVEAEFNEVAPITDPVLEAEEIVPELVVETVPEVTEMTKDERLADAFMKVTNQEIENDINKAANSEFGDYTYIVQLSTSEGVLVYMDYSAELTYYRVSFTQEEGKVTFGEKEVVKPRFLTEEEINKTFAIVEEVLEEASIVATEVKEGTEGETLAPKEDEEFNEQKPEETKEVETEVSEVAFTDSEREELETYRRKDKESLIESFREDLTKVFIEALITEMDTSTLEELDTKLSKEFTRLMKEARGTGNTNTALLYRDNTIGKPESEREMVKRMVETYKDKK